MSTSSTHVKKNYKLALFSVSFLVAGLSMSNIASAAWPEGMTSVTTKEFKISDIHIPKGNKPILCRSMRLRSLDVIPDGQIGIHSHENRPAILTVVDGSGMRVSAWHKPDVDVKYAESYAELNNIVHYAVNLSAMEQLTLTTFDLLDNGKACNGKIYPQNTPQATKLKKNKDPFFLSAPKGGADEKNNPLYEVPLSDIHLPKGAVPLSERIMRARKVTLQPGMTVPKQDYRNTPSFLYVIKGKMTIDTAKTGESQLSALQSINLVNDNNVVISNKTNQPLSWFVYELISSDNG